MNNVNMFCLYKCFKIAITNLENMIINYFLIIFKIILRNFIILYMKCLKFTNRNNN